MYSKTQETLLQKFANANDELFSLGITQTDSFTGELGEFYASLFCDFERTERVRKSIDGIDKKGLRYQVKSKLSNTATYSFKNLPTKDFDFLIITFLNEENFLPYLILKIDAKKILDKELRILKSNIHIFNKVDLKLQKINKKNQLAISNFAKLFNELKKNKIIRSKRIVGDIGEYYACKRLNLRISNNQTLKGIDAFGIENNYTFEIKTRRVYKSDRRISETRRLNNLIGKTADYVIIVTLDRCFKCSGMWILPTEKIINPKSANLSIINNNENVLNLISTKNEFFKNGKVFLDFKQFENIKIKTEKSKTVKGSSYIPLRKKTFPVYKVQQKSFIDELVELIPEHSNKAQIIIVLIVISILFFIFITLM